MFVANAVNHCTTKFWLLHQCDCVVFSSSLNIDLVITRLVGTSKIPFFREVGAFHVIEVFSGIFIGFFFFFFSCLFNIFYSIGSFDCSHWTYFTEA